MLTITPLMGGQTHELQHSRRARQQLHHRWGVKPTIYRIRNEPANDYTTDGRSNPRPTALETSTLTITPPMGVEPTIYRTLDEHGNDYTTDRGLNPRSTALETSTLTITLPMGGQPTIYRTRDEHANDYTTDGDRTHDLPHSRRAR